MKAHGKKGFSLTEMMVGVLALAILVALVGAVLISSWKSWKQGNEAVQMQRDISLAMLALAREIRSTPVSGVTVGPSSLTCGPDSFTLSGNDLQYNGMMIVRDYVDSFSSVLDTNNGAVQVTLQVSAGYASSELIDATFYSRN